MSVLSSDEDDDGAAPTFSTRLSKFKKPPVKSCSLFTFYCEDLAMIISMSSAESTSCSG